MSRVTIGRSVPTIAYDAGYHMNAPTYDPASHGVAERLRAVSTMRCPRCCRGAVWRAPFQMHEACPVCNLTYIRGAGYFTGAMYASYTLGIFGTLPVWMGMLLGGASLTAVLVAGIGLALLAMPISFHYSRVIWLHIDCHFHPDGFIADRP